MDEIFKQILIYLFIAGFIGVLVGWFIRGGLKRKYINHEEKNENLKKEILAESREKKEKLKTEELIQEKDNQLNNLNEELLVLKEHLNLAFSSNKALQKRLVIIDPMSCIKQRLDCNAKINNIHENWEKEVESLEKSLSSTRYKLVNMRKEIKELKENPLLI